MQKILLIAGMTYKEMVRDHILHGVLGFAIIMLSSSFLLATLSLTEKFQVQVSFGLASIHMGLMILAILSGVSVLRREIENKVIYTTLSRPVSRLEFLIGKFLGLWLLLLVTLVFLSLVLFGILVTFGGEFNPVDYMFSIVGTLLEATLILSAAVCISSWASAFSVSALLTACLFVLGHSVDTVIYFSNRASYWAQDVISFIIVKGFPNLELLNWRTFVVHGDPIQAQIMSNGFLMTVLWVGLFLSAALIVIQSKDFD